MTTTPRVSVIMIFLDSKRFIEEAIASVVHQTFTDWELVLVDDGSTDGSTQLAREWAARDPRIRYVDHDGHVNLGMSSSRNAGLALARGDAIAFLDSDDVWLPEHLAPLVATLDGDPTLDATYSNYRLWHAWTGVPEDAAKDTVARIGVEHGSVHEPGELLARYRRDPGTLPAICSVLTRREAMDRIGGFVVEFKGCFEDQVYLAKVGLHLRVQVSAACTSLYRRHPDSCCAVAMKTGLYDPAHPNPAERAYLDWLERYLLANGVDRGETWEHVQRRLVPYRKPLSAPGRAHIKHRVRRAYRARRRKVAVLLGLRPATRVA